MISALVIGRAGHEPPFAVQHFTIAATAASLSDAIRLLQHGDVAPPEVVVLLEARDGVTGERALDALRKLAPLARVWRVLGSWCEGQARSGRPPSGCLTAYWHHAEARLGRQLAQVSLGRNPTWALPATATPDERLLATPDFARSRSGTIAVCAASAQAAAALADLCASAGYAAIVAAENGHWRVERASAVVWDTTAERMQDTATVDALRSRAGGAALVAVVGFPRSGDVELAHRAGVAAVISKPYLADDLLWHLDRVAATPRCVGLGGRAVQELPRDSGMY